MNLQRTGGLNGFQLKLLALVCMTFDHIHYFLGGLLSIPFWFGIVGRMAAPIFIFMAGEGFAHTHSRSRYLLRLYLCSVGMGVLNQLENRFLPHPAGAMAIGNIFATICYLVWFLSCLERLRTGRSRERLLGVAGLLLPFVAQAAVFALMSWAAGNGLFQVQFGAALAMMTVLPLPLVVEGGVAFLLLGIGLYYLRGKPVGLGVFYLAMSALFLVSALPGGVSLENLVYSNYQWLMVLALPLLLLYNGRRGRGMKYLFYIYYPAHMLLLLLLARAIGTAG